MLDIQLQLALLLALFDPGVLLALRVGFCAIVGDAAVTWILAIAKGEFQGGLILRFIKTSLLPYFGLLVLFAILTLADDNYLPVFYFMSAIVSGAFGYEVIKDKLVQYFKPANEPPSVYGPAE